MMSSIFSLLQNTIIQFGSSFGSDSDANQSIITKIVSLLYKIEDIAENLANFIISFSQTIQDSSLPEELVQQLTHTIYTTDSSHESIGVKNVSLLFSILSDKIPDPLFKQLKNLLGLFDAKAYQLRNALVNILGNFVMKKLSRLDDIEEAETRVLYESQK